MCRDWLCRSLFCPTGGCLRNYVRAWCATFRRAHKQYTPTSIAPTTPHLTRTHLRIALLRADLHCVKYGRVHTWAKRISPPSSPLKSINPNPNWPLHTHAQCASPPQCIIPPHCRIGPIPLFTLFNVSRTLVASFPPHTSPRCFVSSHTNP